jgi:hypothetical protein
MAGGWWSSRPQSPRRREVIHYFTKPYRRLGCIGLLGGDMSKVVWYSVPDVCDDVRFKLSLAGEVDVTRRIEQEDLIEQCAEDFYQCHDGWECSWPKEIVLFASELGDRIAAGWVEMEMEPRFSGRLHSST